jgi:molybdenum cofactor cytidylyltransferase
MVPGIVLAAGRSSRMGRPKALLPCGPEGESFVARLIAALTNGGVADVLVVGRAADHALRTELARLGLGASASLSSSGRLRYVENPDPDAGQLSSILTGLRAADRPGVRGVIVIPVDTPLITPHTVAALLTSFDATRAPIVRPVHRGAHGHPVIFSRAIFDELRHADPAVGAKAVVRAHADAIANVEVDDAGVVSDVDTPEDYARLFGSPLPSRDSG